MSQTLLYPEQRLTAADMEMTGYLYCKRVTTQTGMAPPAPDGRGQLTCNSVLVNEYLQLFCFIHSHPPSEQLEHNFTSLCLHRGV